MYGYVWSDCDLLLDCVHIVDNYGYPLVVFE